jgi:hypothetical protein
LVDPGTLIVVRDRLVAALSALITTNGHYRLDVRSAFDSQQSTFLRTDPVFDLAPVEAQWTTSYGVDRLRGQPLCYHANAPQRADPALVSMLVEACPEGALGGGTVQTRWLGSVLEIPQDGP